MARLSWALFFVIAGFALAASAQEANVVPGLITASNVDITADDGSLLSERLNVGDAIYVVVNPKKNRKGWVRISRSPEDDVGFGWVEQKHIRTFTAYSGKRVKGVKTAPEPKPTAAKKGNYSRVAVLPFSYADPDDPIGKFAFDAFSLSLENNGTFEVDAEALAKAKVDGESTSDLGKAAKSKNLDGIFVGKLSGKMGGGRLLQVKFFGRDQGAFVLEKTTRLKDQGNLQEAIDKMLASFMEGLAR